MAKFMFFNVPAAGHINPTLSVVSELTQRGHHVIYYLTEAYRSKIEAAGAEFRPYDDRIPDDYFERRGLDGSNPAGTAYALATTSLEVMPDLLQQIEVDQPDAILFDSMCPWGWMLAQVAGLPSISSCTLLFLSTSDMFRVAGFAPLAFLGVRMLPDMRKFMQAAKALEQRYAMKLPNFADFLNRAGTLTISYTSSMIQPNADKLDPSIKFVGPSIEPRPHDVTFPWDKLDDRPLIYVSLGTVINQNAAFYRACMEALCDIPAQTVMSVGQKTEISALYPIPQNFIVRNFVPQLEILPRAALFITHAGMNSVHESLFFNVPLMLVPQQMEQRLVAVRVEDLGAGIRLSSDTPQPAEIRQTALHMMDEPQFYERANEAGESLRTAGGHARAADEIEQLLKQPIF